MKKCQNSVTKRTANFGTKPQDLRIIMVFEKYKSKATIIAGWEELSK